MTVSVLADKIASTGYVVDSGSITLPYEAAIIHVGLPYESLIETLALDASGDNLGRKQKIGSVSLRVQDTVGIKVGPTGKELYDVKFRSDEAYNEPTRLKSDVIPASILGSWGSTCALSIQQTAPLPMTILDIIPVIEVGDES